MNHYNAATAALAMILAPIASAEIIHVPADHPTIQGAIDAAVDGDEIVVAPGVYFGGTFAAIYIPEKSIVLRSTDPESAQVVAATSIQAQLYLFGGDQTTLVDGFSFKRPTGGGSLRKSLVLFESAATVRNCVWSGMHIDIIPPPDGVLTIHGGSAVVERCRISNNEIYNATIIACRRGAAPTLVDNIVSGNAGWPIGFGIRSEEGCNPTLIGTLMCGNTLAFNPVVGPWTDGGGNTLDGACPCPADIDYDGVVGFGDLLGVLARWGPCLGWGCEADIDDNGDIGFGDLLAVLSTWGPCE
ncbi:MAG: hypothetical protein HKO59_01710 [Phycisphaerales bacterium]|nr:hypothetical protein [Phycisphaerae bacterium]NNM24698.1 hypothetical protein [Phycisphaerales bacterium]